MWPSLMRSTEAKHSLVRNCYLLQQNNVFQYGERRQKKGLVYLVAVKWIAAV